jgi:hypothetical protein
MAYPNISLNGTSIGAIPLSSSGGGEVFQTGDSPRAIDDSLVDLGFSQKERFSFVLVVGTLRSWLKGLKALSSFTFIDFAGNSFTVKMTGLSFSWTYAKDECYQTAQITLEEV